MRLSEIKGDAALDLLADLIDPATEIMADKEFVEIIKSGKPKLLAVKHAIKNHKKAIFEIMARLDGKEPEEYEINLLTLPLKVLEIFNDPALVDLFTSRG